MPDAVSLSVYGVPVSLIALFLWKTFTLKQLIFLSFLLPASVLCVSALVVCGSYRISQQQSQAASRAREHVPAPRLKWATPASFHSISLKYEWERSQSDNRPSLHTCFSLPVNAAVNRFLSHITNNFVLSWWSPLTSSDASPAFPCAVDDIIRYATSKILNRAQSVDWPSLLVAQVLPQLTAHMTRLKQAGGLSAASQTTDQALDLLLSQKYASLLDEPGKPGKLHPAINVASAHTRPSEEAYLRSLFDDILPQILPETDAQSAVVLKVAREIIVSSVLVPLVESISEPDFWNVLIDTKASESSPLRRVGGLLILAAHQIQAAINEREQVAALRAALDRVPQSSVKKQKSSQEISSATSNKEFESFLRSIKRCTSLVEARRLRNDLLLSIRRARRSSGDSEPSEEQKAHLDRLESALRYNDQRISDLGGGAVSPSTPSEPTFANTSADVSLLQILQDSAALTFWMEFMERRRRLTLVQFWLTVEGLRDPLDDQDAKSNRPEAARAAKEDADLLYSSFFTASTTNSALLSSCCSVRNMTVLRNFAEDPVGRGLNVRELRFAIHSLQTEVLEEMDNRDLPAFRTSDLCVKMTSTLYSGATAISPALSTGCALSDSQRAQPTTAASPTSFFSATVSAAGAIPSIFHPSKIGFLGRSDSAPPRVTPTEAVISSPGAPKTEQQALFGSDQPQPTASKSSEQSSPRASSSDPANFALLMGLDDDEGVERAPLFADEGRTSPQTPRIGANLPISNGDADDLTNVQKMQALQEALSGIIESSDSERPQARPKLNRTPSEQSQASIELQRAASTVHLSPDIGLQARSGGPSIKRASSSPESSRSTSRRQSTAMKSGEVSTGATELTAATSHSEDAESSTSGSIRKRIEDLTDQEEVILQLLRSKGLSENRREQKILQSSLEAVRVEKRTLNFRLSEKNNTLVRFGRTSVCIPSTTSGGTEGKDFVLYLVSLQQTESAGASSGWFVPRRYSEFFDLHTTLRDKFSVVRSFDFPSKRLVTSMSSSLVEHRRVSLERYLKVRPASANPLTGDD